MLTNHLPTPNPTTRSCRAARALWIVAAMTALIGALFLLRERSGHVAGYWPYLLLLACPLMHLFMHGGHGGHGHDGHGSNESTKDSTTEKK